MNASPILRQMQSGDMSEVTAIQKQAVLEGLASFSLVPLNEGEMVEKFSKLQNDLYPCIVAEIEGKIAGYANGAPYRPRPGYRWTIENSVYVSPNFHKHGVGYLLLEEIIRQSKELGFRQMIAVIGDSANIASIRLHEKCGFTHAGTLTGVGYKHGKWLDSVMMQYVLGDGEETQPDLEAHPGTLFKG